jgi:hypothetical protein
MMNYSYYFNEEIQDTSTLQYDVFISVYDGCDRTKETFMKVKAGSKYWLVIPQYNQPEEERPDSFLFSSNTDESDYFLEVVDKMALEEGKRICIDSTGFIIPHLLYLVQYLKRRGFLTFDILYSEPGQYEKGESTQFTKRVGHTRPIVGYSTVAKDVEGEDTLIIFAGFNDEMVSNVAREKSKAKHKYLFSGFPSLQADMYQQNLIQLNKSIETIGQKHVHYCKAPANDPFVTAKKLQDIIDKRLKKPEAVNYIHIAPLSTKPMAIASALVYFNNPEAPIDIIYPPAEEYIGHHSIGIKRTWRYTIEF